MSYIDWLDQKLENINPSSVKNFARALVIGGLLTTPVSIYQSNKYSSQVRKTASTYLAAKKELSHTTYAIEDKKQKQYLDIGKAYLQGVDTDSIDKLVYEYDKNIEKAKEQKQLAQQRYDSLITSPQYKQLKKEYILSKAYKLATAVPIGSVFTGSAALVGFYVRRLRKEHSKEH